MSNASNISEGPAQLRTALLAAMPLLALIPKYQIIAHSLYPPGMSVVDIGFGFGGYVRSLLDGSGFRSCAALPFTACDPGVCAYATRMPGIPLLLATLAGMVGTQAAAVATAKCVLLALLSSGFLALLTRDIRVTGWGIALLYVLYFGPGPLKHGATLDYEEGVLLDLSLCLAIALSYQIRPASARAGQAFMALAAVNIAAAMYFLKTTALLTLVVALAMLLNNRAVGRIGKLAGVGTVGTLAVLWGLHNWQASGAPHVSSSWNGENLVRGYDSGALAIYPQISLDRIFDSKWAILDDGTRVSLGDYSERQCFRDEWNWSSAYSRQARQWLTAHPLAAARFTAKKAWVSLLEIRHTPQYISATHKDEAYPAAITLAMELWMIIARGVFFLLLVRVLFEVVLRRRPAYLWVLALLLAACAPYVLVFAYQRHMIPVLMLSGGLFAILFLSEPISVARGAPEKACACRKVHDAA